MRGFEGRSLQVVAFVISVINLFLVAYLVTRLFFIAYDLKPSGSENERKIRTTIAGLQEEISHLKREVDEANLRTISARSVAAHNSPRELSIYLEVEMMRKLRPFPGTWFDVSVNPDPESETLAVQITNVLRNAGWQASVNPAYPGSKDLLLNNGVIAAAVTGLKGLTISLSRSRISSWQPAMNVLCAELEEALLKPLCTLANATPSNGTAVHIAVGTGT